MSSETATSIELPLASDVWSLLQDEAARSGQPATSLVSDVITNWVRERHRQLVAREIAEFAAAQAGSELDLDRELECAAVEALSEVNP